MKDATASRWTRSQALGLTSVLAISVGVAIPLTLGSPAEAACAPAASMSSQYVTTPYRVDNLWVNACAAKKIHDTAGSQSNALILPGLVAGWVPGGRILGTALGSYSGLLWLKQNKLKSCTNSFTQAAVITFSKGVPVSCKVSSRIGAGGSF